MLVHPDSTTSYVVSMDLCGHITYDTVTVWVGKVGVNTPTPKGELVMYPNPSTGLLTVENAGGCSVTIRTIVGQSVFQAVPLSDKEVLDISGLEDGVYFVRVVDPLTGYSAVRKLVKE